MSGYYQMRRRNGALALYQTGNPHKHDVGSNMKERGGLSVLFRELLIKISERNDIRVVEKAMWTIRTLKSDDMRAVYLNGVDINDKEQLGPVKKQMYNFLSHR